MANYLMHHGVQGMKWGKWNDETRARRLGLKIRRARKKLGAAIAGEELSTKKIRERPDNDRAERKQEARKRKRAAKNLTILSDADLNARINRLEREKRYRQLLQEQDTINTGKQKTDGFSKAMLKLAVKTAVPIVVGSMVKSAISDKGSSSSPEKPKAESGSSKKSKPAVNQKRTEEVYKLIDQVTKERNADIQAMNNMKKEIANDIARSVISSPSTKQVVDTGASIVSQWRAAEYGKDIFNTAVDSIDSGGMNWVTELYKHSDLDENAAVFSIINGSVSDFVY